MLQFQSLDDRTVPAAVYSSNGQVWQSFVDADGVRDFRSFVAFDDFRAAHFTAATGDRVAVGAAEGGGPRVQLRQAGETIADFFAFEPSFRGGVHVGVSPLVLAAGAAEGGGPVVAVYDRDGAEISRFFAYDPEFRGGVRVAVDGDRIYTAAGPGGGPHVREFDTHGTLIDEWLVGDDRRRSGFQVLLGDFDHDQSTDVAIWDGTLLEFGGRQAILQTSLAGVAGEAAPWIGSGSMWSEAGGLMVGIPGRGVSFDAIWAGLDNLVPRFLEDSTIGNPNPPATTGRRPGQVDPADNAASGRYREFAATVDLAGNAIVSSAETLADPFVRPVPAGASVGSIIGTGTSLGTFQDAAGSSYLVTARHVVYAFPYGGDPWPLEQPGRADGGNGDIVANPPYLSPAVPIPPATYELDAVAVPIDGSGDPGLELFRGRGRIERPTVLGTTDDPARGTLLVAVGRGGEIGVGYLVGRQQRPITVTWSGNLATQPRIADQWLAVGLGSGDLSYPGYSGGPVYAVAADGLRLVGMTVAGGGGVSIITPIATIERGLGLTVAL